MTFDMFHENNFDFFFIKVEQKRTCFQDMWCSLSAYKPKKSVFYCASEDGYEIFLSWLYEIFKALISEHDKTLWYFRIFPNDPVPAVVQEGTQDLRRNRSLLFIDQRITRHSHIH